MKKKVGIVSLFEGYNFGNRLQNYALQKAVERFGYEVHTFRYEIDHSKDIVPVSIIQKLRPSYVRTYIRIHLGKRFPTKNSCYSLCEKAKWLTKEHQVKMIQAGKAQRDAYFTFDRIYLHFADHLILLQEKDTQWTSDYDFFICGSDQVWNPYYASTSSICFLQFAEHNKRIAYAPSFGVASIPESRIIDFSKWIAGIPHLSVREEAGREIIKELTGMDAPVLVDPTMLLTKEEWEGFAKKPNFSLPDRFLLSYFLGDRTKEYDVCQQKLAKTLNCEIVDLLDLMQPHYYGCSPDEFVYCLEHTEAVCTDSFHACVFSILFRKPFVAFDRVEGERKMSSRIHTLLQTFNLTDRLFMGRQLNMALPDKESIESILVQERKKAFDFLKQAFINV